MWWCKSTNVLLDIRSTLFLMVCCKAWLVCIQTQENIAFLTLPSRHTLGTQVALPALVTMKWPMSTVVITHIWLWLWRSWGVAFLLRWCRAGWWSANLEDGGHRHHELRFPATRTWILELPAVISNVASIAKNKDTDNRLASKHKM